MRLLITTAIVLCQLSLFAQESDSLLFKQARDAYFEGNSTKALEILTSDSTLAQGNQRIAYFLNAGTAHSSLGNFHESNKLFDIAYQIIEDSSKNTGSKAIAYLMNPLATQYEGESAEQLLIHFFKVQNYLSLGNGADAAKEVDKLDARIQNINEIYGDKHVYKGETLFYLLAGIVDEYNGKNETALASYLKAYELYGSYSLPNFGVDAPWQLKADIVRLSEGDEKATWSSLFDIDPSTVAKKDNEVIVFWNNGRSPHKNKNILNLKITAKGMDVKAMDSKTGETFPVAMAAGMQAASKMLAGGTDVNLKFARYNNYSPQYDSAKIGTVFIEPIENLTNVLNQSLTDRKSRDINSMMGRHLAKSVLKNKAKKKIGGLVNRIPGASLVGANKLVNKTIDNAIDNTEKADWRQWDMLPHSISYGRLYLPEGEQSASIIYTTSAGESEEKTETLRVKKGTNVFVLNSFEANEITEAEMPSYTAAAAAATSGALLLNGMGSSNSTSISAVEVATPTKYPSGDTEAIFTDVAGSKLSESQYSCIVGNPENMLQEGTITLTFDRKRKFPASAVKMVILMNGEDKLEVKNGDTEKIQIEANGSPIVLTMRNAIVKQEKNNLFNKRLRVLYYPTKNEENFIINAAQVNHKALYHVSLEDE